MLRMILRLPLTSLRSNSTINEIMSANQTPMPVTPAAKRTMVKSLPTVERGSTSEYPTTVIVITLI